MKQVMTRQPTPLDAACRHLAVCVIERAVRDLTSTGASAADRASARAFLSGSPMLDQWCEIADVNFSYMVARASKLVHRSRSTPWFEAAEQHETHGWPQGR